MAETIVLDPTEVAVSRTQVDITPWVKGDGIDWGDAEIAAYMADQARGASPVDFRVPNRTVTIPLVLKGVGGTSFATARTTVQAKAALFQREGGWLKRLTSSGSMVFADVVSATLKLGGGWMQAHRSADLDAQLTLDVLPDFYGAEVTLPDHSTTTATELVFTETGILGDYPARCRIAVDEDDGDRQLGLIWGLRSRNYDAAATARLAYNAGTLTPQDVATSPGFGVMRHTSVPSMWAPILKTDIIPSGALTHVGTYRVWVQIESVGVTERGVDVRLVWDVGDLSTPVINATKRIPGADSFYALDLGEVRLDRAKSGTHRWQGQVQAKATTAPADVIVSKVWFVPVDDGYGVLRAPLNSAASFNVFTVRDDFNQTSGNLHGKTVQVGGSTWSTFANGASPTDFVTSGTPNFTANRDAVSEQWRGAVAGTASLTDVVVQVDFRWSAIPSGGNEELALFARRINQDNFIAVNVTLSTGAVALRRYSSFSGAGGSYTILDSGTLSALAPGSWYTLRLYVDTAGLAAGGSSRRGIAAVTALEQIYSRGGAPHLDDVLGFLAGLWEGEEALTNHPMLLGTAAFLMAFGDKVGDVQMRRLRKHAPVVILRRAVSHGTPQTASSEGVAKELRALAQMKRVFPVRYTKTFGAPPKRSKAVSAKRPAKKTPA